MVMMVYDMIPELFDFDLNHPMWMEKENCISYAQRFLCISHSTRRNLSSFYPRSRPSAPRSPGAASTARCSVRADTRWPNFAPATDSIDPISCS